jgi:FtsZ-binding cell division protein ZapB
VKKQLKPCPFCGSDNLQSRDRLEWSDVRCKACLQSVSSFPCSAENIWNKRPIEDALQARIAELEAEVKKANSETAEANDNYEHMMAERNIIQSDNDALQAEIETLTGKLDSAKYSDAQFREKAKLLQVELDQLRKDNQSLVEQIHIMAEFLVAEGICPFTPCIHKQPHTDEVCMFCWEHRGNGTKGDKP